MPLITGLDLGTTTITALALDTRNGEIVARQTVSNAAHLATAGFPGRSEWDVGKIASAALEALRKVAGALGPRVAELAGLGLTGQQHGVVLVDHTLKPLGPFINWQDRRAEEPIPGTSKTWLTQIRRRAGDDRRQATGCTLAAGYMGVTLYWLRADNALPQDVTACFLADYMASSLTGEPVVTDATSAASSGLFDVRSGCWHEPLIAELELPLEIFPRLRRGGERQGGLSRHAAEATGLPAGLPVCVAIGDNQASFYGSVVDLDQTVLVNVGTGGQVAAFSPLFNYSDTLETRPFPDGFLLVNAGLCGGRTYAVLENFFRQSIALAGKGSSGSLYEAMNRAAANIPSGADGLSFRPLFTGTRQQPELRGSLEGMSIDNMTPAHFVRALLEGMALIFYEGLREIEAAAGARANRRLVGAGNGLRQNAVLAACVADAFGLPLELPLHREEAAFGAALLAGVGLGILPDRRAASELIRYQHCG